MGESLFALLNRGDVEEAWASFQTNPPRRVLLALPAAQDDPGNLRELPWELIYGDGPAGDGLSGFFFQDHEIPWSLWHRHDGRWAPDREKGPLRVLVVVCEPDTPGLLADQEIVSITTGLATWSVPVHTEVLFRPS
ncbi:hypothetical protein, partial [Frankia sp. Cj3]|uniref:hypothetical protein n=1 Tax=Frankia sp. Cj3 TaxID=2880976 RepID=UPI001EF4BB02